MTLLCFLIGHKYLARKGGYIYKLNPPCCLRCGKRAG
jgi:hypothetical protein